MKTVDSAVQTNINAGILHRVFLVVIVNINRSQVSSTTTLPPHGSLIILVNDDDIVITGFLLAVPLLLLISVEDDVLLHLVTGAVLVITGLFLLENQV